MLWVAPSLARKSSTWARSTAVLAPSEMTAEKPTPFSLAQSRMDEVKRAALRDQGQRPGFGQRAGGAGVELEQRPLETQAVGAQQLHTVALGHRVQRGAQGGRQVGRQDQGSAAAGAASDLQRGFDLVVRQRDDGQVGPRMGQLRQGAGHFDVEKADLPGEAVVGQFGQQGAGHGGSVIRLVLVAREDNDGLGRKQGPSGNADPRWQAQGWAPIDTMA